MLELSGDLGRFSFYRDSFQDAPYRDVFYAHGRDEEEARVRPIYLLDSSGLTHLAEEDSQVLRRLAEVPMQVSRLHYDDADPDVVRLLRKEKLI